MLPLPYCGGGVTLHLYRRFQIAAWLALACLGTSATWAQLLPSWNEGPAKQAIRKFVADVTWTGSQHLVPMEQRVAVFDNDGTLWAEQLLYIQIVGNPGKPAGIYRAIDRQPISPSAIRTGTCRCCNGRKAARAHVSWAWCIT